MLLMIELKQASKLCNVWIYNNLSEPIRMVRPLWCGHYGVYNSVWGFYGAGFLWRATIWCDGAKNFFALWNFWWPLQGPFFKLRISDATN